MNFLQDSSFNSVRYAMSRLNENKTTTLYEQLFSSSGSATGTKGRREPYVDLARFQTTGKGTNVLQLSSRENQRQMTTKGDSKWTSEESDFDQRLLHLKSSLAPKSPQSRSIPSPSTKDIDEDTSQVSLSGTETEAAGGEEVAGSIRRAHSEDSMASISDESSSEIANNDEEDQNEVDSGSSGEVAQDKASPSDHEIRQNSAQETSKNDKREECLTQESNDDDDDDDVHLETSNAIQLQSLDISSAAVSKSSTHTVSNAMQVKRGAILYKFFSQWMRVVEKEMLIRQKRRVMRRLFNQNNRNRRLCESFYAWKFNTRQTFLLSLCLNKWLGLRLSNVFISWGIVVKERLRMGRLARRLNQRRLNRLLMSCFSEWRNTMTMKIFTTYREMRAKTLFLEDEVDELRDARSESNRYKDNLYNVLSEVAEIGVNLLKVENGGEALIDCCARVENILRLNSAYVPPEALDSALASIDWSSIAEKDGT